MELEEKGFSKRFQPRPTMGTVRLTVDSTGTLRDALKVSTPSHYGDGKTRSSSDGTRRFKFQPRPTMGTVRLKE